jgi:hypothetical protein
MDGRSTILESDWRKVVLFNGRHRHHKNVIGNATSNGTLIFTNRR